jgi:hypothetical protein
LPLRSFELGFSSKPMRGRRGIDLPSTRLDRTWTTLSR